MSFNIATRLNNLQYQINQKTGNPLTSDLNCAGFDIDNAGIINYTSLNPPVSPSTQNINQTLTIGNNAGNLSIVDLSAVVFSNVDGVNEDVIISQLPALGGRINIYKQSDTISPFASSATVAIGDILASGNITAGGNLNVGASTVPSTFTLDGSFVLVNDGPASGQCILSCNTSNELVVSNGLRTTGNISCNVLNYSSLNPPVGGGTQNLSQVLTTGNDATGLNISNVGNIFTASVQGVGVNGRFQIGDSSANFYSNNDGAGNKTLVLGNCITNFANSGLVLNLNDPVFSSSPATKNYVDNKIALIPNVPYSLWYPLGSGGAGVLNIPATAGAGGAYSFLWFSPAIPTNGKNLRVNIQLSNVENAGGTYANVLESYILVSPSGAPLSYTTHNINPYNQVPPARGWFWSPNFNGWFNIDTGLTGFNPLPTNFYVAVAVRQSLIPGGYLFNGSDVLLTVYPL